jgi:hypothetical protein
MRKLVTLGAVAAIGIAACVAAERPVTLHQHDSQPVANIINTDLDLKGTPNLIVRDDVLRSEWLVRDENLSATACSVIEGGITPGLRRLIRFTVMTPNIGDADIFIGDPNDYFQGGQSDLYEFAQCHNHYHFKHYALYELVQKNSDRPETVWRAAKRGFCMLDTDPNPAHMGEPARANNFFSCGTQSSPGNQGISHGWADTYRWFLAGQFFVLDGGDGQPVVPAGKYYIRITVNPPYTAATCPRAQDPETGMCHQFEESDYTDNMVEVPVTIPAHPGRSGYGPAVGKKENRKDPKWVE